MKYHFTYGTTLFCPIPPSLLALFFLPLRLILPVFLVFLGNSGVVNKWLLYLPKSPLNLRTILTSSSGQSLTSDSDNFSTSWTNWVKDTLSSIFNLPSSLLDFGGFWGLLEIPFSFNSGLSSSNFLVLPKSPDNLLTILTSSSDQSQTSDSDRFSISSTNWINDTGSSNLTRFSVDLVIFPSLEVLILLMVFFISGKAYL